MYTVAHFFLVLSFLSAIFCVAQALIQLNSKKLSFSKIFENANFFISLLLSIAVLILLFAFASYDFSLEYVAQYSDLTLPLFYRLTALWAGQSGSLLFWAWLVAISGLIFSVLPSYKILRNETKLWFWAFFFCIMAFFLILLTSWSQPFIVLQNPPANGMGLNPLLQNPGMIFHPPLLFLGYGGFVVPSCLALAQTLSGQLDEHRKTVLSEAAWYDIARPFILVAWLLLTAGIILGAWWAYMELGWGGYWAWDPVENASLLPWLISTAFIHTSIIEMRLGKFQKINVFLMALTTISAFFATYLVRSGVIQSLHAYPDGGVGLPLLIFVGVALFISIVVPYFSKVKSLPVTHVFGVEGLLSFVAWILLALAAIILIATLWPVLVTWAIDYKAYFPTFIQKSIPLKPLGLEAIFYNKTCLPLFAGLSLLLMYCPLRKMTTGWKNPNIAAICTIFAALFAFLSWSLGIQNGLALFALTTAFSAALGILLLFVKRPKLIFSRQFVAAHGVHIGFLLIVAGIALSGPYQSQHSFVLNTDDKKEVLVEGSLQSAPWLKNLLGKYLPLTETYTIKLNREVYDGPSSYQVAGVPHYHYLAAELIILKEGEAIGLIEPQVRLYASNQQQFFREVDTLFSLGNEVYATLSHSDEQHQAHISLNINPLVNWIWIGGILMTLFPLLGLRSRKKNKETGHTLEEN